MEQKQNHSERLVVVMTWLMRLVVGGTFIFSGWAKAIDPWGTFYKFGEYMFALGWGTPAGVLHVAAHALAAIELMLGVALVTGCYRRGAPVAAFLLMLVMTPLTLWLAVTDAVPDCGCFGDVLRLSNWATFAKNVALMAGVVYLWFVGRRVRGLYGPAVQWMAMAFTLLMSLALSLTGHFTQPLVDFRPYHVGTELRGALTTDGSDMLFVYEREGMQQTFTIDSLPDEEQGWEFVERRPDLADSTAAPDTSTPSITALDHGTDVAADMLDDGNGQLLFLFPDLPRMSLAHAFAINELGEYATAQGASVYALASASDDHIARWIDVSMATYPVLVDDDSEIKMIARGDPAVVYINDHKIVWKRTLTSLSSDRIHDESLTLATLSDDFAPATTLRRIMTAYAIAMLALLLVNRTHVVARYLWRRNTKKARDPEEPRDLDGSPGVDDDSSSD